MTGKVAGRYIQLHPPATAPYALATEHTEQRSSLTMLDLFCTTHCHNQSFAVQTVMQVTLPHSKPFQSQSSHRVTSDMSPMHHRYWGYKMAHHTWFLSCSRPATDELISPSRFLKKRDKNMIGSMALTYSLQNLQRCQTRRQFCERR